MKKVIIAAAVRTPLEIMDGALKTFSEQELAALVLNAVLARAGVPADQVDEIILGNGKQTSLPSNCARHASLLAKLPVEIPAYTVQRQSASGIQAVANGYWAIRGGDAGVILAGGTESMSQIPREIHNARFAFDAQTRIVFDPIPAQLAGAQPQARYGKLTMQAVAEHIAERYCLSGDEMESYAAHSREKARLAQPGEDILPVTVKKGKGIETLTQDGISSHSGLLADAGDGAAACLLMGEAEADTLHAAKQAEILSVGISAGSPTGAGYIGIEAVQQALEKAQLKITDIGQIWLNDLSAAQGAAFVRELVKLGISYTQAVDRLNPAGGALAYGNPWGASGAVLISRAVQGISHTDTAYALVLSPAEGGQAMAMLIKKREQ